MPCPGDWHLRVQHGKQAYTQESVAFMEKIINLSGLGKPSCGYLPDGAHL